MWEVWVFIFFLIFMCMFLIFFTLLVDVVTWFCDSKQCYVQLCWTVRVLEYHLLSSLTCVFFHVFLNFSLRLTNIDYVKLSAETFIGICNFLNDLLLYPEIIILPVLILCVLSIMFYVLSLECFNIICSIDSIFEMRTKQYLEISICSFK